MDELETALNRIHASLSARKKARQVLKPDTGKVYSFRVKGWNQNESTVRCGSVRQVEVPIRFPLNH